MPDRDLNVGIDGDPSGFNRATKSAEKSAAKFRAEINKLEGKLKRLEAQQAKTQRSAALMRGELASLVAGAVAVSPAFVAAGSSVVAFGALAVPSILGVIKAQKELADTWDSLSGGQKVSAVATRDLIDQYRKLSASLEPETLANYNTALGITSRLMPRLTPLAREGARAMLDFQNKLAAALDSDGVDDFFRFLEREAGPAMDDVGDSALSLVGAAGNLLQALAPLATTGLTLVRVLSDLLGALSAVSPELAQLVTLSVALRAPMGALGDFIGGIGDKAKKAGVSTAGMSKGMKLANLAAAAGPNVYLAAGVALAFLATKALTAKTSADKLVASMRALNGAVGNNLKGYDAMNRALDAQLAPATARTAQASKDMAANVNFTSVEVYRGASAAESLTKAWTDQAKAANNLAKANITAGAKALADQYGVTSKQALALADVIGLDLSKGILENGNITSTAASRVQAYISAVEAARNPTALIALSWDTASNAALGLKDRVDAVTGALDAFFNPSLAVYNATTNLRQAFNTARKAIKDAHGDLSTTSEKSLVARDAFGAVANQVAITAGAIYTYTSRTQGAEAATAAAKQKVLEQLPALATLAGRNKSAQDQVAALARSYGISGKEASDAGVKVQGLINKINNIPHSASTTISANTAPALGALGSLLSRINSSSASVHVGVMGGMSVPGMGHAGGGYIRGPGTTTSDSIWARLSDKEFVVNADATADHLPLLQAINAGRYAKGGQVGRYATGGQVTMPDAPLSDLVSRYIGTPYAAGDKTRATNARKDQLAQLKSAERKLAEDKRLHRSRRTIADDEANVAKQRRDVTAATTKLKSVEAAYAKAKLAPSAKLQNALTLGIKNTAAFIKNITKIADMGFGPLAQQLLAMGGPEAEKFAADAAKLSKTKLSKLNTDVVTSQQQQAQLDQLPAILKIKEAQKKGAKSVGELMNATGLSEDELAGANQVAKLFAGGGIRGYAGGKSPGVAKAPIAVFGEAGREAFIPYDQRYRSQAVGLVNQVATDFGMTRRTHATAGGLAERAVQHVTNHITITGAMDPAAVGREVEKVLNKLTRDRGRTTLSFSRR